MDTPIVDTQGQGHPNNGDSTYMLVVQTDHLTVTHPQEQPGSHQPARVSGRPARLSTAHHLTPASVLPAPPQLNKFPNSRWQSSWRPYAASSVRNAPPPPRIARRRGHPCCTHIRPSTDVTVILTSRGRVSESPSHLHTPARCPRIWRASTHVGYVQPTPAYP